MFGRVCLSAKTHPLLLAFLWVSWICVATNEALRFSCVVLFEATHFFYLKIRSTRALFISMQNGGEYVMGVRHMQGTPAQLETLRTNDGKRRYPTHCINCEEKSRICKCPLAVFYSSRCRSSSKCTYYEERD